MLDRVRPFETFEDMITQYEPPSAEERAAFLAKRNAQINAEMTQRNHARYIELCKELSNLGDRFADRTFENFRITEGNRYAAQAALDVAINGPYSLGLFGPCQVGKTHLAAAIVNHALERGVPAIFKNGVELIAQIQKSYGRGDRLREGAIDIVTRLAEVPLLVLDDLGKEPFTPDTARLFYLLVNKRFENKLPLIVTTNRPLGQIASQWNQTKELIDPTTASAILLRVKNMCTMGPYDQFFEVHE